MGDPELVATACYEFVVCELGYPAVVAEIMNEDRHPVERCSKTQTFVGLYVGLLILFFHNVLNSFHFIYNNGGDGGIRTLETISGLLI